MLSKLLFLGPKKQDRTQGTSAKLTLAQERQEPQNSKSYPELILENHIILLFI